MKLKSLSMAILLGLVTTSSAFSMNYKTSFEPDDQINDHVKISYGKILTGKLAYQTSDNKLSNISTIKINDKDVSKYNLSGCVVYGQTLGNLAYMTITIQPYKITCKHNVNNKLHEISLSVKGVVTGRNNNLLKAEKLVVNNKEPILQVPSNTKVNFHLLKTINLTEFNY